MILTRDYIAHIRIFCDKKDFYERGRDDAAEAYLKRHGWTVGTCVCGKRKYKGFDVEVSMSAKKSFTSIEQMQIELDDIESAFHDAKNVKDGYYSHPGRATFFDKENYEEAGS